MKNKPLLLHFCTVGVQHSRLIEYILSLQFPTSDHFTLPALSQQSLFPSITSSVPAISNKYNNIIVSQLFPNGYDISTKPTFTNDYGYFTYYHEEGSLLYCSYVKTYNELSEYKKASSEYKDIKERGANTLLPTKEDMVCHDIFSPIDIKPLRTSESISSKKDEATKLYEGAIVVEDAFTSKRITDFNSGKKLRLFFPIYFCIISKYPYLTHYLKLLKSLSKDISTFMKYPIENYIEHLLQIQSPSKGNFEMINLTNFSGQEQQIIVDPLFKLPIADINFQTIIAGLPVELIISSYNAIILEKPIIFVGKEIQYTVNIIEGFKQLMYPFKMKSAFFPNLPSNLYKFMTISDSYVIGICGDVASIMPYLNDQTLVVDLTSKTATYSDKSYAVFNSASIKMASYPNTQIPKHELEKLKKRINACQEAYKYKSKAIEMIITEFRTSFLNFLVDILKLYEKFIKNQTFDAKAFINQSSSKQDNVEYKKYAGQLIQTKHFKDYMNKKLNPKKPAHKQLCTFFDENITKKMNRYAFNEKKLTPFLDQYSPSKAKIIKRAPINQVVDIVSFAEEYIKNMNWYSIYQTDHINYGKGYYYRLFPEILSNKVKLQETMCYDLSEFNKKQISIQTADAFIVYMWIHIWIEQFQSASNKIERFEMLMSVIDVYIVIFGKMPTALLLRAVDTVHKYGNSQMILCLYTKYKNNHILCYVCQALLKSDKSEFLYAANRSQESIDKDPVLNPIKPFPIYNLICKKCGKSEPKVVNHCTSCRGQLIIDVSISIGVVLV